MTSRKEKERDFFVQHMSTFRTLGLSDPFFVIKTAFFQKGKFGKQVQFFESELKKGEDIYVEFYENVKDSEGKNVDIVPLYPERQLFKYRYNPFFDEEYEKKEGTSHSGDSYLTYTVPVSELVAVLENGSEITFSLFEKRKEEAKKEDELPRLQQRVTTFPDFEEEFSSKSFEFTQDMMDSEIVDEKISEMTIRDFAAIMLEVPVSSKPWLNELISMKKS